MDIHITSAIAIPLDEIEIRAIRSRGPGGQNVNKVATAVQLRFDIGASSLPQECKTRLRELGDRRITADGVIIITAREHRSRAQNRQAGLDRLVGLIRRAVRRPKERIPTRPSRASRRRRLEDKRRRSRIKALRGRLED